MASALSHPAAVLGLRPWFGEVVSNPRVALLGALCSVLPDIDAIGFWAGVPYDAPLGHRGLTHSFAFAIALAAVVTALLFRRAPSRAAIFGFLFLCAASHGVFDAMTDGGMGVAFFAPFDDSRFFLPWRPVRVSPIGLGNFFGRRGLVILRSELLWIWLPCLALALLGRIVRGSRPPAPRGAGPA